MDDYQVQSIASSELHAGEQLVWWGQPSPQSFARQGLPLFFFGIPWTLFSGFWVLMALLITDDTGPVQFIFPLFGLPFVLIGFWMLAQPLLKSRQAMHTVYAITTRRALIITGTNQRRVISYEARDMDRIETIEKSDGSGDLLFVTEDTGKTTRKTGFYGIPQVKSVELFLRDHLRKKESSEDR